jgi:DNA helicase-2/ATP-dependent DNA helicase PcrA
MSQFFKPNHTDEQKAIILAAATTNHNLVIDAKAGSGKTTTLLDLLPALRGSISFNAFNRSIADEINRKVGNAGMAIYTRTEVRTMHSLGLKAFNASGMKAKTLSGKLAFMLKDMIENKVRDDDDLHRNLGKIRNLVSNAKSFGFGLESAFEQFPDIADFGDWSSLADHFGVEDELIGDTTIDEVIEWSIKLLKASNQRTNSIDFDDMIYLPLLLNLNIPTYANVLLDEAQDINATRRELAFRSVARDGRMIAVGDPNQAIYGFTGADPESLNKITLRAEAEVYPLTICWRCDASIIAEAQAQVPEIRAKPNAQPGQVLTIDFADGNFLNLPEPGDAILCRLNKPNVAVCLGLLRRGKRAKIEGRDLGAKLLDHAKKANQGYAFEPLEKTLDDLAEYRDREVAKLVARNKAESTIATLEDEIEATELIMQRCIEVDANAKWTALEAMIDSLFGDDVSTGFITLSSIHKSKGREWSRVFILGYDDYMPFHLAKAAWEKEQEQNLIYVAKTRAERTLVYVNGAQSAIDRGLHRKVNTPTSANSTAEAQTLR